MQKNQNKIIEELLSEFKVHRDAIMTMVNDLEVIKTDIDRLIPKSLDARYVRFFEEKVKTATELFKTLLDMRKEIQKSLKEEVELRRKIDLGIDKEDEIEKFLDIRKLATRVEKFRSEREQMKKSTLKKSQDETDEAVGQIVQITESG